MVLKVVSALEAAHHSQVHNYLHTMYYALIRVICVISATKKHRMFYTFVPQTMKKTGCKLFLSIILLEYRKVFVSLHAK